MYKSFNSCVTLLINVYACIVKLSAPHETLLSYIMLHACWCEFSSSLVTWDRENTAESDMYKQHIMKQNYMYMLRTNVQHVHVCIVAPTPYRWRGRSVESVVSIWDAQNQPGTVWYPHTCTSIPPYLKVTRTHPLLQGPTRTCIYSPFIWYLCSISNLFHFVVPRLRPGTLYEWEVPGN